MFTEIVVVDGIQRSCLSFFLRVFKSLNQEAGVCKSANEPDRHWEVFGALDSSSLCFIFWHICDNSSPAEKRTHLAARSGCVCLISCHVDEF